MPSKRRVVDSDSEAEALGSSPASKRPRTSQQEETHGIDNSPLRPNDDDEARFEQEHEGVVMEQILGRKSGTGGIAEMGIIESVTMANFMCHTYLKFVFGPQVNFIIGHNGSGKSAVLSAITVALGGKATVTGRGSGLKSFIREGQQAAEVTIVLKNQGEEAFKPQDYGKSISIIRKFTKDGSSSYKIMGKDGNVMSTKREELSAICDHMNIQVDNPMNILTQDAARQFLSASHATDKYRFFLKGTQLSQLSDEYELCMENIVQTDKILSRKRDALPDLRAAYRQAHTKFKEANKAIEQRHRVDELKRELAWAHVAAKEKDMREKFGDLAKAQNRLPKLEDQYKEAEVVHKKCTETIARLEEQLTTLGNVDDLQQERKSLQDKIKANKDDLLRFQSDMKRIQQDLTSNEENIVNLGKQIEEEARRMETNSRDRLDEAKQRLDETKAELEGNAAHLKSIEADIRGNAERSGNLVIEERQLDTQLSQAKTEVSTCKEQIKNCDARMRNKLAPYGTRIDEVVSQVKTMKWHGKTPVGPLGVHVKLKDMKWADVMKVTLGSLMNSWAVTDARDRQTLKTLLMNTGNRNASIIIAEVDLFDFSQGEPSPGYLTPLRVLEISDPYVVRIMVNQAHIESVFLAPHRAEGDDILMRAGGVGVAWCADSYLVRRFHGGGGQSQPLGRVQHWQHQLFTGENVDSDKRKWMDKLASAEASLKDLTQRKTDLRNTTNNITAEKNRLSMQAKQVHSRGLQLKAAYDELQAEANEDLPAGIAGLQEMKDGYEAEKVSLLAQYEDISNRKAEVDALQQPLVAEVTRLRRQIDMFEESKQDIASKIEDTVASRMQAQQNMRHWTEKKEKEQKNIEDLQQIADVTEEEFKNWTKTAEQICEKVNATRSVDTVQRNLESVSKALKDCEKKQGASVEELTKEVTRTKHALDSAQQDISTMVALNKELNLAVKRRLARWHDFRRHIALRCKVFFQYNLSNRGYFGKVLFDHAAGTLNLKVQTELTGGNQVREKDPKALSGGEKSFSTICLLLALWESIGCPIRCLDEFDVFMDAVNRRISTKMITDTAKASDGKQYVLITPQTVDKFGTHVRVHRMQDPERGQGVLSFAN